VHGKTLFHKRSNPCGRNCLKKEISAAGKSFPGGSYEYASIDHSAEDTHQKQLSLKRETAAEMKEF
jgi:hypothetical protein